MKEVRTQKRYKCDFCKKRSIKRVVEIHEKRCFRNPNRFCDYCDNKGYYYEDGGLEYNIKVNCPFCERFNPKQLEEIEQRERTSLTSPNQ